MEKEYEWETCVSCGKCEKAYFLATGCAMPIWHTDKGPMCEDCYGEDDEELKCSECGRVLDPDDAELDDGKPHCVGECPEEDPWDFNTGTWKEGMNPFS